MNTRERIVIFGTLTLLLGINISAITGGGGRHAVAAEDPAADQLGPAEALTLVEKDHRLVLRNQAGRLSWGDDDHARAYSIGFVHVGKAVGPLIRTESTSPRGLRLISVTSAPNSLSLSEKRNRIGTVVRSLNLSGSLSRKASATQIPSTTVLSPPMSLEDRQ